MNRVAQAGWQLWVNLIQDDDFVPILQDLDKLTPGSTIDIATDSVFIPWEIIYPENVAAFETSDTAAVKSELFWGARYIIQATLLENKDIAKEKRSHTSAIPRATVCINPSIDDSFKDIDFKPAASHNTWAKDLKELGLKVVGPEEAKQILLQKSQATKWIYFFCHGRGGASEALELGSGDRGRHSASKPLSNGTVRRLASGVPELLQFRSLCATITY